MEPCGNQNKAGCLWHPGEYERALNRYVRTGKPEIMIFFKDSDPFAQEDSPQRKAMLRLRKRIGQDNVMFGTFQSTSQFAEILYDQLLMILAEFPTRQSSTAFYAVIPLGIKGRRFR